MRTPTLAAIGCESDSPIRADRRADPKNFMDIILEPKLFGFDFQLLPYRASCPDHLSTKITKRVKVKMKLEGNREKNA